jgi:hypothetical protein
VAKVQIRLSRKIYQPLRIHWALALAAYEKLQLIELILLGGPEYPVCNLANVPSFLFILPLKG